MKKILFIILIFLLCICSCKKNNGNNDTNNTEPPIEELNHYDFKTKEEISNSFDVYRLILKFDDLQAEFVENNDYLYYTGGSTEYLVDKKTKEVYVLDVYNKLMSLTNDDTTYETIRSTLLKLVAAHVEIKDSHYLLSDDKKIIAGVSCSIYYYESKTTYRQEYYVSDDSICFKRLLNNYTDNSVTGYEIISLTTDSTSISEILNEFAGYEIEPTVTFYKIWPPTTLGNAVPEFRYGTLSVAWDNGEECYIYKTDVTKQLVLDYVSKLTTSGFDEIESGDNEAGQYVFIGKNSDNIVCNLKFDSSTLTLSIDITQE